MTEEARTPPNRTEADALREYSSLLGHVSHFPFLKKNWSDLERAKALDSANDSQVVENGLKHVYGRQLYHVLRMLERPGVERESLRLLT